MEVPKKSMSDVETARQYYAEELRAVSNLQSEPLVRAFAKVPRERFLGPGPWQILNPSCESYRTTPDAEPKHLYHNMLVAIDSERGLNNGQPGFLALLIDALELQEGEHVVHVGCGTGYYTAILAEVVGPKGHVAAIEIDPGLAACARNNLSYLRQVDVIEGDGGGIDPPPRDAILINAGATHPRPVWLDSLRFAGRLIVPLTVAKEGDVHHWGRVLKITCRSSGYGAHFISEVWIFPCSDARDPEMNEKLKVAFAGGPSKSVQSFRREAHEPTDSCWLHAESFCLSKLPVA